MTREEAIEQLQDAKIGYKEYLSNNALDMAIKALEHPEKNVIAVVPCGDCISRQAAIDAIRRIHPIDTDYDCTLFDKVDVMYVLSDLPSVTPQEPKTGHWIRHREHCENLGVMPSGLGAYKWCSNCDCGIDVREWHRNNYNYCPNCGAKMVEPQENEEV